MSISPAADALLTLLSVYGPTLSRSVLIRLANEAGLAHPSGRAWTPARFSESLDELHRAGLAHLDANGCPAGDPSVRGRRVREVARLGELEPFRDAADRLVVLSGAVTGARFLGNFDVHMRLALHLGEEDDLLAFRDIYFDYFRRDPGTVFELERIELSLLADFEREGDEALLEDLPFGAARHLFARRIRHAATNGEDVNEVESLVARRPFEEWGEELASAAAFSLFARGRIGDARAMLDRSAKLHGVDEPEGRALRGILLWIGGDEKGVDECWAAVRAHRKAEDEKHAVFDDLTNLLFVAALLTRAKPADLRRAVTYGKKCPPLPSVRRGFGACSLAALAEKRLGKDGLPRYYESSALMTSLDGMSVFGMALGRAWSGEALEDVRRPIEQVRDRYRDAGWLFIAQQMEALLGEESSGAACVPVVRRVEVRAAWEHSLAALEKIALQHGGSGSTGEAESPVGAQRLVFELHITDHFDEITPILQKRNAKGWTRGRRVSMEKLAKRTPDYADAHDQPVLAEIRAHASRSYRYQDVTYMFSPEALSALVGHPRVRLHGEDGFVPVVARDVVIVAREERGRIAVQLDPPALDRAGASIDELGRVAVVHATPAQQALAEGLRRHGSIFPLDARDRVAALLGTLATVAPVQADALAVESGAREIAPDATPHARISRVEEGLQISFRVLPLGADGPAVVPGEGNEVLVAERHGEAVQTRRDLGEERRAVEGLLERCPTIHRERGARSLAPAIYLADLRDALAAVAELRLLGDAVHVSWPDGAPLRVIPVRRDELRGRLSAKRDWLEVKGEVLVEGERVATFQEFLLSMRERPGRFVELSDGRFLALERTLAREVEQLAAFVDRKENKTGPVEARFSNAAALGVADLIAQLDLRTSPKLEKRLEAVRATASSAAPIPKTLRASLRPYQVEGFRWLARLSELGLGGCLADDMGLGKTVQAIALLLHRASLGPALVSAPTSVCAGWRSELARFAPTLNVRELRGGDAVDDLDSLAAFDVVVASHGILTRDIERLERVTFATAILDEAQAFKNSATARAQAAYRVDAAMRVATTGTPIENHLGELHSLFRFVEPQVFGSAAAFKREFMDLIEKQQDANARSRLRARLSPFILRRTKTEVLDELPPRTDVLLRIPPSPAQRDFYEAIRRQAREELEGVGGPTNAGDARFRVLAALTRLRQACCHPAILAPELNVPSAKTEAFVELLAELREGGHRALVFSQFVRHLDLVRGAAEARGVSYQYLDGSTPARAREERVRAFQAGEGDVFFISLKAGGTGLNLTGADYVIHLDPWWNPAVEDQATDRAHRIGQKRPVTAYRLILEGTVEEQIVELHQQKRELASDLLSGADMSGKLSVDDLLAMMR